MRSSLQLRIAYVCFAAGAIILIGWLVGRNSSGRAVVPSPAAATAQLRVTATIAPTEAPTQEQLATAAARPTAANETTGDSFPCKEGQIKGNRDSNIYHAPGQASYAQTQSNVACFDTEADAQAAGYTRAQR